MSLHHSQIIDDECTHFKCYRSIRNSKPAVYVEIAEGYTTPGWAGGDARKTTLLQFDKETLVTLSSYFQTLAQSLD